MTITSMEHQSRDRSSSWSHVNLWMSSPVGATCNNLLSPSKLPKSPTKRTHLKTAGQSVFTPVGSIRLIGVGSPKFGESSLPAPPDTSRSSSDNSPSRRRSINEAMSVVGSRCRTTSEASIASCVCQPSPKAFQNGARSRASSNVSNAYEPSVKASSSIVQMSKATPLPKADVDWLLGTLCKEDLDKFECRFFVNDCRRRFRELDSDKTGLLSLHNLQIALVDMYPTLQLDLSVEGHRIPALHKSMPSLIATFDSDADGYLDFDEFVRFVKFQHAWRAQFFFSRQHGHRALSKVETHKGMIRQPESSIRKDAIVERVASDGKGLDPGLARSHLRWSKDGFLRRVSAIAPFNTNSILREELASAKTVASRSKCKLDESRGAFYCSFADLSTVL